MMDQEAFFTSPLKGYVTLRDMAVRLNVNLSELKSVVERNAIAPAKRRGVVRLWSTAQCEAIEKLLTQR